MNPNPSQFLLNLLNYRSLIERAFNMWIRNFGIILLGLVIVGCASTGGYPERPEKIEDKLSSLQSKFFLPTVDVLSVYASKTLESERREYRDTVVHGRLLALDMQFALFKEAIYEEGIVSNLSLDILGVVVGAAGAVTTSADTSRVLSALSGGISGTQIAINKNLFYERTMPALLALMDAERSTVRAEILEGLTQEASVYPLGRALTDLERYLQVGSIPGAIASVTSTAGQKKSDAEAELKILRTKEFVDPEAQKRVASAIDSVDQLPVGKAWDILNTPPTDIDQFVASTVKARLGGIDLANAASRLGGAANDGSAKAILKMVLVIMKDRSPNNITKWNAAIQSQLQ
jgi:hypothetical protein